MKYKKKFTDVNGKMMAYIDEGSGDTVLFLHGNPTSSFLWRNIAPYLEDTNRVVIPDLIGMGDSEKLDGENNFDYKYHGHYKYLTGLMNDLNLGDSINLVIHDWGSAMGFQFAREHPERINSITYMEAVVMPLSWEQWPDAATKIFELFRSETGEELVLEKNFFVERILLADSISGYTDEEKEEYIRPFKNAGEDRRPTLTWPRQIPLDGEPKEVVEEVEKNADFHKNSEIPKLFINAEPGSILTGDQREFVRTWKNQKEITVKGNHFIQEDSADEIGAALREFITNL
jgi:haloalkane dehalogenase